MEDFYKKISTSRFYYWGDKLGDIMIASLLWFIFCIPVVTILTSSSALYYALYKKKDSSLSIAKLFIKAFTKNLRQGLIINLIYLAYCAISFMCIFFGIYGIGDVKLPDFYLPFSFITLIPVIFSLPFAIGLIARFSNSIKATIKNSFNLSLMNPGTTLINWFFYILGIGIVVYFPPAILVIPALVYLYTIYSLEKVFAKFSEEQHD